MGTWTSCRGHQEKFLQNTDIFCQCGAYSFSMNDGNGKFANIVRLLDLLAGGRWVAARELAGELGVDLRTVYRYIQEIDLAFSPAEVIESGRNGYRLVQSPFPGVSMRDCGLLAAASGAASPFISGRSGDRADKAPGPLAGRIRLHRTIPATKAEPLLASLAANMPCRIEYATLPEKRLIVQPLRIVSEHGIHYCQCLETATDRLLLLALDKMRTITPCRERLPSDRVKRALAALDAAWGIMAGRRPGVVRFSIDGALLPYFENGPLHASQTLLHSKDGGARLSLRVHDQEEFLRWTLRFGRHLRITGPESIKGKARRFHMTMWQFYNKEE
jgi:predicted DNA-binding transcriptional regulator YafY